MGKKKKQKILKKKKQTPKRQTSSISRKRRKLQLNKKSVQRKDAAVEVEEKEDREPDYSALFDMVMRRDEIEEEKREAQAKMASEHRKVLGSRLGEAEQEELESLVSELIQMTEGKDGSDEYATVYLGAEKEKTREIGERLNELGGHEAMSYAYHMVYPTHPTWAVELDWAFHKIGDWLK